MSDLVTLSKDGDVAVVTINNPPVNALSPGVPEGVIAHVQAAAADPSVKAIVLIGGGKTFVAGADIKEFAKIRSGAKERGPGSASDADRRRKLSRSQWSARFMARRSAAASSWRRPVTTASPSRTRRSASRK